MSQTPGLSKDGPSNEERQGKAFVDSAINNHVKYIVYSPVDRHGDASIKNPTDVPHFARKHNIELHIFNAAKGTNMDWTILRPVDFMEDFDGGFFGQVFASGVASRGQVAAASISLDGRYRRFCCRGVLAAKRLQRPLRLLGGG